MMFIKINGVKQEIEDKFNLAELIRIKGLSCNQIVVEHNQRILAKEAWREITLNENDTLEIVSFVGGG